MNETELSQLLTQPESPILEFKREWYQLESENQKTAQRHKHELIKDILSLANGHTTTAGQDAYLIIGADDQLNEDGTRTLYDMGTLTITSQKIQGMVNRFVAPALSNIRCQALTLDGYTLWIITILASPSLYETTQKLLTSGREYSEHVVLFRRDEHVCIASAADRAEIAKVKEVQFNERFNADPHKYGSIVGAIIGGLTAVGLSPQVIDNTPRPLAQLIGGIIGALFGAGGGYSLGSLSRELTLVRFRHWPFWSSRARLFSVLGSGTYLIGASLAMLWLSQKLPVRPLSEAQKKRRQREAPNKPKQEL